MKKFITAALTGVLLSTAMLPSGISVSAQTETATLTETIEIKNYRFNIEVTDDGYTVKNDETGETSNLRYIDKFNAVVTDSDGNEVSVIKDNYGRTYKDGELIGEYETYYDEERAKMHKKTEDDSISTFAVEYYDDDPLNGHEHYNYYNTTRGSTELEEDVESVVYALASLLPYIGPAFTVIGVLNSMQNSGASTVYTIQDQFHSDGYRYYRYFTTYHEESDYSDLQGSSNQYARMW